MSQESNDPAQGGAPRGGAAADGGVWRPGGSAGSGPLFTREELERALAPHLEPGAAAEEAATIARTLRHAAVTGVTLTDEVLAMLAATSEPLESRVEAYRAALWARRRDAWLRRELRAALAAAAADAGGVEGVPGPGPVAAEELEAELERRWAEYRTEQEREWASLLGRVRLAVEQKTLEREGVPGGGLVQLGGLSRRARDEPGAGPGDGAPAAEEPER